MFQNENAITFLKKCFIAQIFLLYPFIVRGFESLDEVSKILHLRYSLTEAATDRISFKITLRLITQITTGLPSLSVVTMFMTAQMQPQLSMQLLCILFMFLVERDKSFLTFNERKAISYIIHSLFSFESFLKITSLLINNFS